MNSDVLVSSEREEDAMNLDMELREIPLEKLKDNVLAKKNELQACRQELIEKINQIEKKIAEYDSLEKKVSTIQRYFEYPIKLLSLLQGIDENDTVIQEMIEQIRLLSFTEIVKNGNISEWIQKHNELYQSDKLNFDLLKQYENRLAIKNIEIYDATLKAMYNRRFNGDVFQTAINYLQTNNVVEREFTIQNLIADYKHYESGNIIITERYWDVLKKAYFNKRDNVFVQVSLSSIIKLLRSEGIVSAIFTTENLIADLKKVREDNYIGRR
jgi:hypothetical protein